MLLLFLPQWVWLFIVLFTSVKAPVAITTALATTYVLGWIINIVYAFCQGPLDSTLSSPTGLPAAQMYYNVLGKKGGVIFIVFAVIICNFTGATALQAQARTLFALTRDEMLPFSNFM